MSQFRNLVFEGGGVKGIACAGAIDMLDQQNIIPNIQRVAGITAHSSVPIRDNQLKTRR